MQWSFMVPRCLPGKGLPLFFNFRRNLNKMCFPLKLINRTRNVSQFIESLPSVNEALGLVPDLQKSKQAWYYIAQS